MFFKIKRDYGNDVTQEEKEKQRKEKLKRHYCQPHRIL